MLGADRTFTMDYRNNQSYEYTVAKEESTFEVSILTSKQIANYLIFINCKCSLIV